MNKSSEIIVSSVTRPKSNPLYVNDSRYKPFPEAQCRVKLAVCRKSPHYPGVF